MITSESSNNMQLRLLDGTASSVNVMSNLAHVMAASIVGLIGRVAKLEIFSHYVARKMGFVDAGENRASFIITQVLSSQSQPKINLKNILLEATREHRFERIIKKLKVARVFSTLVEEIKAIKGDSQSCDDKVSIVQSERSPVLLLMGGGMGSGKSTVLKDILREALNSKGHHDEMLQSAELVHQTSTDAASSLLVTALNKGRDVIMDSTLAWEPFLEQTIAMARNVHKKRCLR
ncbi:unnamed protein product [Vicia faba]|uniref:Zeta toxin domain-containing protein n=1 Tax=Vicia faba TaxID=3906 RepID=A0AAV0Z2R3_VICFA|nr:unnamed protein product [Vicia faba]